MATRRKARQQTLNLRVPSESPAVKVSGLSMPGVPHPEVVADFAPAAPPDRRNRSSHAWRLFVMPMRSKGLAKDSCR